MTASNERTMTVTVFIHYQIDPFQRDAFEAYREPLKADPEGAANFCFAQEQRFIAGDERTFLAPVR